jgi:TRAP-type uncharacterized transport system substrate-binding protein
MQPADLLATTSATTSGMALNAQEAKHTYGERRGGSWANQRARWYLVAAMAVLLLLVGLLVQSMPPRTVRMATGEAGSAYELYALRYQQILARHGVRLELETTNGSLDNLARLSDERSGVSIALLQGGTGSERNDGLVSLGTVGYEPLWLLYTGSPPQIGAGSLSGKHLSLGPDCSGTQKLVRELIEQLGQEGVSVARLPSATAIDALLEGKLEMVAVLASFDAPVLRRALAAPTVRVLSFLRADAHVALRPYLNKLVLPQGLLDMSANRPAEDVTLLAPKTSLAVRASLHPAIQYLLLQAASEVHAQPRLFQAAGQFPAPEPIDLPLSPSASNYYKSGPPFLQRYLPFWVAALVSELLQLLIPVVALAYPILRLAPGLYAWTMRQRIFRLYGELKHIEMELEGQPAGAPAAHLREALDRLERRAHGTRMPKAFAHMLYDLRLHIRLVRERMDSA